MASIDRSPTSRLPLMKKVGVELTASLSDGVVAHRLDVVEHLLIRQAGVEGLLGEAELLGDRLQRFDRLLHHPIGLLGEQRLDHRLYLSLPAQRASMKPAAASASSGNSRIM